VDVYQAAEVLETARKTILDAAKSRRDQIESAKIGVEKRTDLTPQAQHDLLQARYQAIYRATAAEANRVADEVAEAVATVTEEIDYAVGSPRGDVAATLERQAMWHRYERLLTAKRTTPWRIIDEAPDHEALHVCLAELPMWLDAQGGDEPAREALRWRCHRRFVDLAGSDEAETAWQALQHTGGLDKLIANLRQGPQLWMGGTIEAEMERQRVLKQWQEANVSRSVGGRRRHPDHAENTLPSYG
jgi:hypothetical protein